MMGVSAPSSPFGNREAHFSAGTMGLWFFLAALAVLFASTVLGYWVIRLSAGRDATIGLPELPNGLWFSTVILLASSGTMHWAILSIRNDRSRQLQLGMLATTVLGVLFLALQTRCWVL